MDRSEIAVRVRGELAKLLNTDVEPGDLDLLADHGVDSLSSVQLTLNIEDSFDVFFEDGEINVDNFATIDAIVNLLDSKLRVVADLM